MDFTDYLYDMTKDIWLQYESHPFIKGLIDGSLDQAKFRFYMIQDYLYLINHSKIFAIASLKSKDLENISKYASFMDFTLNTEMKVHKIYMERLAITKEEIVSSKEGLVNLSYTNYMLSQAQMGGFEEVIATLLSCAWTYAFIGKYIDQENPQAKNHDLYGEWVTMYIDEDFQASAKRYKDDMNILAKYMSPSKKENILEIFKNCCLYELRFWDMCYSMSYDFDLSVE